jgi:tetratricopeptide (TPR) repeat protein
MGFWSKKNAEYWVGVASRHLEAGEPEKALKAVSRVIQVYKLKPKTDQESQAALGVAAFFSGCAYVQLKDWSNARFWLDTLEAMNPPNKKWLEDLRREVERLEAECKENYLTEIDMIEATGGEEGVLLAKGFRDMGRGSNEEAIEAFNEVLKSCGLPDPQMGVKERAEYDQKISIALLGLVLSYSGLATLDKAKEYLEMLDHINPKMADEFRETWKKSPPHG